MDIVFYIYSSQQRALSFVIMWPIQILNIDFKELTTLFRLILSEINLD